MEEFVGELWHRFITRSDEINFEAEQVSLTSIRPQLATLFRAMGGEPGKIIEGTDPRLLNVPRKLKHRLAGTHRKFVLSWQDERSLRLPPAISFFPDQQLNEDLYIWLTALSAQLPTVSNWFEDNQRASLELLKKRPGLRRIYQRLAPAVLNLRPEANEITDDQRLRELVIRQAIIEPGSQPALPETTGDAYPVHLWLYPAQESAPLMSTEDDIVNSQQGASDFNLEELTETRKQAQREDDSKETDGFLIFQLESLFSWTEQVQLDRCQDDSEEDDAASVAQDMDIITLSRQRRAGASRLKFDMDLPALENDDLPLGDGIRLPEWNFKKSELVKDYCLLQPMLADLATPVPLPDHLKKSAMALRRQFSLLQSQPNWQSRLPFGEEIDLDAWIENVTQPVRDLGKQNFYRSRTLSDRDLACLLLADISMSTDSALNSEQRIIDVVKDSMLLFGEALVDSGDKFAMYGFSSVKNKQVRFHLFKNFNEPYSDHVRGRISEIKPGFYTRMGTAIRQSTNILVEQKARQRLLLIVSDGKPNDIDQYDGRYGIEDTRKAIQEAKQLGLLPFCVTVDNRGNDYLPYLFGDNGYVVINDLARLPTLLPKLYLKITGVLK